MTTLLQKLFSSNEEKAEHPFFADDEVPCVNTNECHAKAAGKCPFRTRDFEDCAGKECTVQQSEQERFRNTDIFQTLLQKYQKVFGEIIFPDEPENGQSEVRREIYANPAGWMYSHDGLRWRTAPMDIGKIAYENAMFRRIPEGIIVGINEDVKKAPQDFLFSSSVGVFHGRRDGVWFRRKG